MAIVLYQIWDRTPAEVWIYLGILVFICLLYAFKDYIRILRFIFSLDGPVALPVLGNANYVMRKDLLHIVSHNVYNDYGPIFRFWLTFLPYVTLLEPADIQCVLSSAKHTEKIFFYRLLDNFLGKGLITRDVVTWKGHRKILQPAFHLHLLERFTKSFSECATNLMNKIINEGGRDVNITSFVNDSVYDILNETVLGVTLASGKNKQLDSDDDMPFRKGQVVAPYRITRPWLLIEWIYQLTSIGRAEQKQRDELFNACHKMMERTRQNIMKNGSTITDSSQNAVKKISLLEFMVEISGKHPEFTDEDIINECCTFMLAGQDSVGTATAMTLFLLANHQDWQRNCFEELEEIFGKDERSPTMKDFRDMKCLEMCIKETLRLFPPVPFFARTLGEDVVLGKQVIPAGCGVFIMPYATHRLAHHFPDPHTFNPQRFDPEVSNKMHPYAFLPFSAGPRNCIGNKFAMLEMKSMISAIIRKCHLGPVTGKEDIRPKFRLTVRAEGGLWVKITPRSEFRYQPYMNL
ncbi:probable cytochrome P450 4aa1 isoform X2 [Cephus cinctus]|uniref:Probable cytochrome P450 4aa1 isoform X2 n=1 Tax=Cephus cinctus TaxID=211228 RepID=A0AAJ7W6M8_CEPCN|nr:probable cytochrome P450 4aa1 isoform X2 [Cephus cinctus]XP_024946521.1 probable cytochrome P450 4aa1 isoform X2 [Cephus cinctus]XP_024946522.1 probable cytochrome P450 4aa1 isoform X2 [Cephus cinctus]